MLESLIAWGKQLFRRPAQPPPQTRSFDPAHALDSVLRRLNGCANDVAFIHNNLERTHQELLERRIQADQDARRIRDLEGRLARHLAATRPDRELLDQISVSLAYAQGWTGPAAEFRRTWLLALEHRGYGLAVSQPFERPEATQADSTSSPNNPSR